MKRRLRRTTQAHSLTEEHEPNAYEQRRAANIARNASYLASLEELYPTATVIPDQPKSAPFTKRLLSATVEAINPRKSARIVTNIAEHVGSAAEVELVCVFCQYKTYKAGPLTATSELQKHLAESDACRISRHGGEDSVTIVKDPRSQ